VQASGPLNQKTQPGCGWASGLDDTIKRYWLFDGSDGAIGGGAGAGVLIVVFVSVTLGITAPWLKA
jgi:hypothetical protein